MSNSMAHGGSKPIAIPATTRELGSPFLRAYPPVLERYSISYEQFLSFLDDLNRTTVKSPPLQILSTAGMVMKYMPLASTQTIGHVMKTGANFSGKAVSKGRTEMLIREANRDIFTPRGLKCEIAHIDAVAKAAGMPVTLNWMGKVSKDNVFLKPIEDMDKESSTTGAQRRVNGLEPFIEHLEVAPLEEVHVPDGFMSRWSANASEKQRHKGEEDLRNARSEAYGKHNEELEKLESEYRKKLEELDEKLREVQSKEEPSKVREETSKIEEEKQKIREDRDKEMVKIDKDRGTDDKEEEGMRKILWLLIRDINAEPAQNENPVMH